MFKNEYPYEYFLNNYLDCYKTLGNIDHNFYDRRLFLLSLTPSNSLILFFKDFLESSFSPFVHICNSIFVFSSTFFRLELRFFGEEKNDSAKIRICSSFYHLPCLQSEYKIA